VNLSGFKPESLICPRRWPRTKKVASISFDVPVPSFSQDLLRRAVFL